MEIVMLPTNAPSILTCALRLPPASTTAMSMGFPISLAFRSAPPMTRRASSSVMVSFVFAASAILSLSRCFPSMLALESLRRDFARYIRWHDLGHTCSMLLLPAAFGYDVLTCSVQSHWIYLVLRYPLRGGC